MSTRACRASIEVRPPCLRVVAFAVLFSVLTPVGRLAAQESPESMMRVMETMNGPLGVPMSREGSGTSWQPDSTPMYAMHRLAGPLLLMLHGNVFMQYLIEGGDRGDDQFGSVNWVMGMARRQAAGGTLMLRMMMSAEAATVGECGYPDLLATGESCNGGELLRASSLQSSVTP